MEMTVAQDLLLSLLDCYQILLQAVQKMAKIQSNYRYCRWEAVLQLFMTDRGAQWNMTLQPISVAEQYLQMMFHLT